MRVTDTDLALAAALADAAGAAIRPFHRADYGLETKDDTSLVTHADRAAEFAMRALINRAFPANAIIGGEYGVKECTSGRAWMHDPIDGTCAFITGRRIFVTLISLVIEGWTTLGVIDQLILNETWLGVMGRPTLFNGRPAQAGRCPDLAKVLLATTSPALFDDSLHHGFEHLDVVVEAGLKLQDFAALALVPVVGGAGGRVCAWQGDSLIADTIGEVVAAGVAARIEEILGAVACRGH